MVWPPWQNVNNVKKATLGTWLKCKVKLEPKNFSVVGQKDLINQKFVLAQRQGERDTYFVWETSIKKMRVVTNREKPIPYCMKLKRHEIKSISLEWICIFWRIL